MKRKKTTARETTKNKKERKGRQRFVAQFFALSEMNISTSPRGKLFMYHYAIHQLRTFMTANTKVMAPSARMIHD